MLRLERPLIVLDVETTGVDVEKDRVVSLAWCKLGEGGNAKIHHYLVNPYRAIPPEATAVHGITDDMVANAKMFDTLAPLCAAHWAGSDVAGFNARSFDLPLLQAEFRRVCVAWPFDGAKTVDVFRVYNRMEPRTLGAACRHYLGEEHHDAHDAAGDVARTVQVLQAQAERYGATSLDALAALERDPSWLDSDGKLRMVNGVTVVGFGKWQGKPLSQVDHGYLAWCLAKDFPADFHQLLIEELARRWGISEAEVIGRLNLEAEAAAVAFHRRAQGGAA